jgi:Zn-finger nucleic acid-binding protein
VIGPCCKKPLLDGNGPVRGWQCPNCASFAVNANIVRDALGRDRFSVIWSRLRGGEETNVPCPSCLQSMNATVLDGLRLDACPVCTIVWFDAGEWDAARAGSPGLADPTDRLDADELRQRLAELRRARNNVRDVD